VGKLDFTFSYDGALYPDRPVSGQNADMGFSTHRVRLLAPIAQSDRFEWAALGGLKVLPVDTQATLPDTGEGFPDQLWDVDLGTAARWKLDNGWIVGGDLVVGSASDRPFASIDEMSFQADALLRVPWRESFAWIFLLNYSNIREFAPHFPLPGVTLAYEPGPHLQILAGVPYSSLRWTPTRDLEISASYFIVRTCGPVWLRFCPAQRIRRLRLGQPAVFRRDRPTTTPARPTTDADRRASLTCATRVHRRRRRYAFDRFWFEGEDYRIAIPTDCWQEAVAMLRGVILGAVATPGLPRRTRGGMSRRSSYPATWQDNLHPCRMGTALCIHAGRLISSWAH
jgi:hypothetical protein